MPEQLAYMWAYFSDLNSTRDNYGWGPTKLKFREIKAWAELRQVRLDAWELEAILELDTLFMNVAAKAKESQSDN